MLVALKVKSIKKKQTSIRDLLNKKLLKHYVLNSKKKTLLLYFAKILILPQFWLIQTFDNLNKNVFPLRVRIRGCVLCFSENRVNKFKNLGSILDKFDTTKLLKICGILQVCN